MKREKIVRFINPYEPPPYPPVLTTSIDGKSTKTVADLMPDFLVITESADKGEKESFNLYALKSSGAIVDRFPCPSLDDAIASAENLFEVSPEEWHSHSIDVPSSQKITRQLIT